MDALRVALRFRDVREGVDTVAAHRQVIARQGAVWWGWWKKQWEPQFAATFERLAAGAPGKITLVDRSTQRAFHARYLQAATQLGAVDQSRIPEYYRKDAETVAGWFLLDEVLDVPFDEPLSRRLGESTFLILDGHENGQQTPKQIDAHVIGGLGSRNQILHLSDLHFGSDYAFLRPGQTAAIGDSRQTLTRCLIEDLARLQLTDSIGAVVVTGDFTTRGDWSDRTKQEILAEFRSLLQALGLSREHLVTAPGNHDIQRFPEGRDVDVNSLAVSKQTTQEHQTNYRIFQEQLTGRRWDQPLNYSARFEFSGVDVVFAVLDSCGITATSWTEYGFVGTGGFDVLRELTESRERRASRQPLLSVLALHHHLVPVASVETPNSRGVSLTLNAAQLLDAAATAGIGVILHGHQHLARVSSYARLPFEGEPVGTPLVIVSGGSAGAGRLPGSERNTYSLLSIEKGRVRLCLRELRPDAKAGMTLFRSELPVALTEAG